MGKQPAGFVEANYKVAGITTLIVGIASLLAKVVDYFIGWFSLSNVLLYFGVICILFGLYLIYLLRCAAGEMKQPVRVFTRKQTGRDDEVTLFRLASQLEKAKPWIDKVPEGYY